ncbi:MAG: UDP-N-acetylmuramate--L-alanine ligase [Alphaproteobacteria bacterium]|nr:UDP-N-acetylmuramate--L-alanine ligase [Alphaproteobacteria bacterium]
MRIPPQTVHHLHFIGIGGIGMSGIAEVLYNLGYQVKGSDIAENNNTNRLQKIGIPVSIGHKAENVHDAQVVIVSSAVKNDNPEVVAARSYGIPVIQRAEMLAELMRLKFSIAISGTHGKTTTTSLAASLLDAASMDPTVINGGIINAYNTNARLGTGDWTVVEADESDGSFVKLPATIAIVTNIDPEHMEFYGDIESLKKAFLKFVANIPFYGLAVLCADHPTVMEISSQITDRRIITYGFDQNAMIRAVNMRMSAEGTTFDVDINRPLSHQTLMLSEISKIKALPTRIKDLFLPMVGKHNVQNALSAIAIAQELGLGEDIIRKAFMGFKGVKRRFTKVGVSEGVTIIDDYAHHPVEIKTVLEAARQATTGKIIAVIQPHRYSRLSYLFDEFSACFKGCDQLIIAPVYGAGEAPIEGATSENLAKAVRLSGDVQNVYEIEDAKEIPYLLRRLAKPGDIVLCLGAGSITYWAASLPALLDPLWQEEVTQTQEIAG